MKTDSVDKILSQLQVVALEDFTSNDRTYSPPPGGLVLSGTLFREFRCKAHCGGCCLAFSLDWLPEDWSLAVNRYPGLLPRSTERWIEVNGDRFPIHSILPDQAVPLHGKLFCEWVDFTNGNCSIHEQNPLTCRMEPIKFHVMRNTGYLKKAPFGRGWAMGTLDGDLGADCEFSPPNIGDEALRQLREVDIPNLVDLQRWADYFGVPTELPKIIRLLTRTDPVRGYSTNLSG